MLHRFISQFHAGTFRSSSYTLSSINQKQRKKEIRQIVKWSRFKRLKTMEGL